MPLTEAGLQGIRDRVVAAGLDWGSDDDWTILANFLTEDQANPEPQGQVERDLFLDEVCTLLADSNLLDVVRNYPAAWRNLCVAVVQNDRATAATIVQNAYTAGAITLAQRDAIQTYAAELVNDPGWPALVSWAWVRYGRVLTREHIAAARP